MESERFSTEEIRQLYSLIDNITSLSDLVRQHKLTANTQQEIIQSLRSEVNPIFLDLPIIDLQMRIETEKARIQVRKSQSEENQLWYDIQGENEQVWVVLERLHAMLLHYQDAQLIAKNYHQDIRSIIQDLGDLGSIEGIHTSADVDHLLSLLEQQTTREQEIYTLYKLIAGFEIIEPLLSERQIRSEQEWRLKLMELDVPSPTSTENLDAYLDRLKRILELTL